MSCQGNCLRNHMNEERLWPQSFLITYIQNCFAADEDFHGWNIFCSITSYSLPAMWLAQLRQLSEKFATVAQTSLTASISFLHLEICQSLLPSCMSLDPTSQHTNEKLGLSGTLAYLTHQTQHVVYLLLKSGHVCGLPCKWPDLEAPTTSSCAAQVWTCSQQNFKT